MADGNSNFEDDQQMLVMPNNEDGLMDQVLQSFFTSLSNEMPLENYSSNFEGNQHEHQLSEYIDY